ncbi:MAG TPA: hypothetical protein VFA18_20950 [Gemmataceae bacterium]|nr:hypothetical protein [Gemmataceae bacterium]
MIRAKSLRCSGEIITTASAGDGGRKGNASHDGQENASVKRSVAHRATDLLTHGKHLATIVTYAVGATQAYFRPIFHFLAVFAAVEKHEVRR